MAKLQQFNGGVNSRKAEHLLAINEGPVFNNIDIEEETLKPVKGLGQEVLGLTDEARYIKYEDDIVTLVKTPHTFVEYQDKIYYSVLGDYIQVKDDTTEGDLGLPVPDVIGATLGATLPATPVGGDLTVATVDATGSIQEAGFITGDTYNFAITRVDTNGVESIPFLFSETVGAHTANRAWVTINVGYAYRLYQKIAGVWKRYGSGPFGFTNFTASVTYNLTARTTYLYVGYVVGWTGDFDIDAMIANDAFNDETTYVVTAYSSDLGWESAPSDIMTVIPDAGGTDVITLTIDIIEPDSRIDRIRIYRTGGNLTDFTLVEDYEVSSFPFVFSDHIPDTSLAGNNILNTENNDKMFSGPTNLHVANGQLICTYGTRLYFSEVGKLYAMPPTNYRDFKETLVGCFLIDAGLLIFSATTTWLLNTSNLAAGKAIQLSDEFGCVGHETIVGYKTGAMWASLAGLCTSFGGKVELITKDKIGYIDLDITRAQMYNETYFGFTDRGVCYALDMRYTPAFMSHTFSLIDDYDITTEIQQVYIDGTELKMLFGSITDVDSLTLFGSSTNESLSYQSPNFLDGAYTEVKTYKDIYVRATAGLTFTVSIDGEVVSTDFFTTEDTHNIKLPQETQQGYSIQFQAIGNGELYEIEYKAMGRQNGR